MESRGSLSGQGLVGNSVNDMPIQDSMESRGSFSRGSAMESRGSLSRQGTVVNSVNDMPNHVNDMPNIDSHLNKSLACQKYPRLMNASMLRNMSGLAE